MKLWHVIWTKSQNVRRLMQRKRIIKTKFLRGKHRQTKWNCDTHTKHLNSTHAITFTFGIYWNVRFFRSEWWSRGKLRFVAATFIISFRTDICHNGKFMATWCIHFATRIQQQQQQKNEFNNNKVRCRMSFVMVYSENAFAHNGNNSQYDISRPS